MATKRLSVLLAEDDRDTREMYSEYLRYSGFDVTTVATGRRAFDRARTDHPDVVVTDIAMPVMDGLELSRRLRADESTRDVPIIALSAQPTAGAREAGANAVLEKPCEPMRLVDVIEELTRGS
jgi:two-component system, cell cycle response regulator DivK